ncbi:reverse transcriptase domain-containing protein [Tanacetum coccineum]
MTTSVEKRNASKFCEFHGEVGHNIDEFMHLRKQIEEMLKAGKLSHLIKELKQNNGKEQLKLSFPPLDGDEGTEGPMIIEAEIRGHCIHRMYVDGGSALEIMYKHCFSRLRPKINKKQLVSTTTPLIGFSGEIIWTIGQIQLLVTIGDEEHSASAWMNFVVVRSPSPYNGIITRPGFRKLHAVPSTAHGMLKIPVKRGVITLKSSRLVLLECAMVFGPESTLPTTNPIVEERIKVEINPEYPEQTVMIGSTLTEEGRNKLCNILQRNLDIFTQEPADMIGVPRHIAEHLLNVWEGCSPVRQKKRGQAADRNQIDRNLEVYVDDLVIKSRMEDEIIRDIEETFKTLREINMKLNPKKYAFGVEKGMFLGYKVNAKGLKVCPNKVDFVLSLPSLKCLKDVQKLNGKLASLNRFLAKSAEKSLPFFKTLKKCTKKSDFRWTMKAEEAFKQMKQLIAELPMLTTPMEKEELIVYLVVTKETVSAVLITEREAKQMPIYFVSKALRGPKLNYTSMEKLENTQYIIDPKVSVKGQILADFIVERPEDNSSDTPIEMKEELPEPWILFTDRSSCTDGSRAGLILTNPKGMEFTYALRFRFDATNNEAEYEALIAGLRIAEEMGVKNLQANVDSRLVANQVNGTYIAKEADMIRYLEKVKALTRSFKAFSIKQIPRSENKKADALKKMLHNKLMHSGSGIENEALEINLDLLEERREEAAIRDLVYRNNDASRAEDTGKLGPKWEAPYEVTEALRKGAYNLRDRDGKQLPRTWNISNLKKCYVHKM